MEIKKLTVRAAELLVISVSINFERLVGVTHSHRLVHPQSRKGRGLDPEVQEQVLDATRHLLSMIAGYKRFSDSSIINHIARKVHSKDVFVAGPVDPGVFNLFMVPTTGPRTGLYR